MGFGLVVATAPPGAAFGAPQSSLVNVVPSAVTPAVNDGLIEALAQVGTSIFAGGTFHTMTGHGASSALNQPYVFSFDQSSGAVNTSFRPRLDGEVHAVAAGPTAGTVYVAGAFRTVDGVTSKGLALVSTSTGAMVSGFKMPPVNGMVNDLRLIGSRVLIVGSFTTVGGVTHDGVATLKATTGALDPYVNVQLTGHHNYNGTGSSGSVGGRAVDVSPDQSQAVIVGNFKMADGVVHDQIVRLNLASSAATVNTNWNTAGYSARCKASTIDSYTTDVDFAPDGSYFVVTANGYKGGNNTDGTAPLCDSVARWTTSTTGTDVLPVWVDHTGGDSLWSVVATGSAIYAGGHQRWMNNPQGSNNAGPGGVPRPGIVAVDPVSGLPFSWNPGRNPRGAGAYALLATSTGLYVGSDTDYIGNRKYLRPKLAYFPVAGGEVVPSASTDSLPGNLYAAGPTKTGSPSSLVYRSVNGSTIGSTVTVSTPITWSSARGVFAAGNQVFLSQGGAFYKASFSKGVMGSPVLVDPYDDPNWDGVQTGSGDTYQGVKPAYYTEMSAITGAFFSNGRLYYSRGGLSSLYWRSFEPESGIIGSQEYTVGGASFTNVAGMTLSGTTLYYANKNDGTLHTMTFLNGVPNGSTDHTVSGPGVDGKDWRANGLFVYNH